MRRSLLPRLVMLTLLAPACTSGRSGDRCNKHALVRLGQSLEAATERERTRMVWPGLEAACGETLPGELTDVALQQWFLDRGLEPEDAGPITRALLEHERRANMAIQPLPGQLWPHGSGVPLDEDGVVVHVTKDAIIFDGEVMEKLQDGALEPRDLGPLPVLALQGALERRLAAHRASFEGPRKSWQAPRLLLAADADTSFGAILEVLVTANAADLRRYAFIVESPTHALEQLPFDLPFPQQMPGSFDPEMPARDAPFTRRRAPRSVMSIELRTDGASLSRGRGHDDQLVELRRGDTQAMANYARLVDEDRWEVHQVLLSAEGLVPLRDLVNAMVATRELLPDVTVFGSSAHRYGSQDASRSDSRPAIGGDDDDVWPGLTDDKLARAYRIGGLEPLAPPAPGRPPPRVRQLEAEVSGELDPDIIRRIVRAHINELRSCYAMGLSQDPTLDGRITIRFVIAPEGKVASAVVKDNSMKGGLDVANCMTRAFERWKFPKPRAGQVTVTSPFELESGHISE